MIATSSHGCEWAAENIALHLKPLGAKVIRKPEPCDLKIMVGYYQRDAENPELLAARRRVVWWVGTDILWMEGLRGQAREQKVAWLNRNVDEHWAEWDLSKQRLERLGLERVRVVHMPTRRRYRPLPLPKKFTVGVYCYNSRQAFYGYQAVMGAARIATEIDWIIYPRYKSDLGRQGNVECVGRVSPDEMEGLYERMSCHARIVEADGMPQGPMEAAMCARPVIYNYRQMEHMVWLAPASAENIATRARLIRDKQEQGQAYNLEGSEYWRAMNDPQRLINEVERLI